MAHVFEWHKIQHVVKTVDLNEADMKNMPTDKNIIGTQWTFDSKSQGDISNVIISLITKIHKDMVNILGIDVLLRVMHIVL